MAPTEWRTRAVRDLCLGIYDGPHATPKKTTEGPIFLGISSLDGGRLDLSQSAHLSETDYAKWTRRVTPQSGDVVFSYETRLGEAAIIPDGLRCCLGRRMALMRPDPAKVDPRFLLYAYLGPDFQTTIRERTVHGSTVERILLTELPDFSIRVPDLPTQRRIAGILGALDDKIELNRRMNRTLESIARAIFKSWFVDFDPVRRKMKGGEVGLPPDLAAIYPGRLDEATGIPNGWRRGCLRDITEDMFGGDWGSDAPADSHSRRVRCLRGADIPLVQHGGLGHPPPRYLKPTSLAKRQLRHGDLVVEVSGGSPTQSTGRCALVRDGVLAQRTDPVVCSNFCRVIRPTRPELSTYVYLWLRRVYEQGVLFDFENGTTGIKNLAIADFAAEPILLLPQSEILAEFDRYFDIIQGMRESLCRESERLASIRDQLLPHLLSGPERALA